MKKLTFLIFTLVLVGYGQTPNDNVEKWYLVGNSAQGDTFSNLTPDINTAGAVLAQYRLLGARLVSNDSTYLYLSVDRKLTSTWAPYDSVVIHPASGAGADTIWTIRSNALERFQAFGAQYRFRLNYQTSGNASQSQATKPRITLWLEGVR